ncbi:NarQ Signal transduction histidine kinase, nitrate/nitrite-specific [Flavobacteriaceae bacterium]
MKNIFLLLIGCLFIWGCHQKTKQVESNFDSSFNRKDSLDVLYFNLSNKKYDTIIRGQLSDIAETYRINLSYEKFFKISKIIESKSAFIKDTFGILKGKSNIGLYYYEKVTLDSAYLFVCSAEKISNKNKHKLFLGSILRIKANILWCHKDYSGAEATAIQALKIASQKKYVEDIIGCYMTIGNCLEGMNNYEKALDYYNKAILKIEALEKPQQNSELKNQTHNYIARIYQKQNLHQKAIAYLENTINFEKLKKSDLRTYSSIINTIAYSKFKLNDPKALPLFKEVLQISESTKIAPTQVEANTHLGEYYLSKNDTLSAKSYFNIAQKLAHKNQIFEDELKILRFLALANPKKNTYYSNRFIQLNDSLQSVERATRDKFARIEFETDEVTSNNKVVQAENSKLSRRILFIASFSLLFLLVIFLWIRMNAQKNKSRELLLKQEQQKANEVIYQLMLDQQQKIEEGKNIEKLRISQELHDGVMGKLSSIRLNLYVLNKKTDEETIKKCLEYIKEIQSIEKEIRKIAHDLNRNLFSSDVDFIGIVENIFTAIKNHSNIDFDLKTGENIDWSTVSTAIKINIYRIIQEALQNIDKYAAANKVAIRMDKQDATLIITISDDGIGFNTKNSKNGIGLQNMQKRAEECNGTFNIVSTPKKGTKISLAIPI